MRQPHRALRTAFNIATYLLLLATVSSLTAVAVGGDQNSLTVLLAALTPWAPLTAVLAVLLTLLTRHRPTLITALATATAAVLVVQPYPHPVPDQPHTVTPVTVLNLNTLLSQANPHSLLDTIRHERPDFVVLEELNPALYDTLTSQGINTLMPYHYVELRQAWYGTGIWSRTALVNTSSIPDMTSAALIAHTVVRGTPVTIAGVHPVAPIADRILWIHEFANLTNAVHPLLTRGALLISGDFNANRGHRPYDQLLQSGLHDTATTTSWAWDNSSWPANGPTPFPVLRIDHVLYNDAVTANSMRTVHVPGSDHEAIVAKLTIR
jgi:endonuclease/exonuclease/phosphatase (EEP) superfamily protein YafD